MKVADDIQPFTNPTPGGGDNGDDERKIWVLLVERPLDLGGDLTLYMTEPAALEAAHKYVAAHWPGPEPAPSDPEDAIWAYNLLDVDEHLVVGPWVVESEG